MPEAIDPAELSIFNALFAFVAEEMGVTLGRTAHSPNIKERRDYSCAVFDAAGDLVAQAAHIPVHLGAMPTAVRAALPLAPFHPGDLVILNDPYLGGTHLPDITMVSPVFAPSGGTGFSLSSPSAHPEPVERGTPPGAAPSAHPEPVEGGTPSARTSVYPAQDSFAETAAPRAGVVGAQNDSGAAPSAHPEPVEGGTYPALAGFVACRAHHADVGGISPGSMPLAEELLQEGLIIPPLKLFERGALNRAAFDLLLRNMRNPDERRGDLDAQVAAQRVGEARFAEIIDRYGLPAVRRHMRDVMDYAERMTRAALATLPDGKYDFEDALDDDGMTDEPVPIRVRLTVKGGGLHCDFTGSAPDRPSSVNAVAAVTRSAVYYVVRCLLEAMPGGESVPSNEGCFRPVTFTLPEGTVVNAREPRPVAAGNVETSQRIVDAVLGALAHALPDSIPAASCGSMNNVSIGGWDPARNRHFAYYETIAGGAGASPGADGLSAVHTHMTNTMNTPVEALELAYPFRVTEYAVRRRSGGRGRKRGGDGVRRTWRFLVPATVTLLTERRLRAPWGLAGGSPGTPGRNTLRPRRGKRADLPPKGHLRVSPGDTLTLETPGGGGWGG